MTTKICVKKRFLFFLMIILAVISVIGINLAIKNKPLALSSRASTLTCPREDLQCRPVCFASETNCTKVANKNLPACGGKSYQCSNPNFPVCCLPNPTPTLDPNQPSPTPTVTCLRGCPVGHCLVYDKIGSDDDYVGRSEKNPNDIKPGNGRDDIINEAQSKNDLSLMKNGCYDYIRGNYLVAPNRYAYDQQPFPYLSGKNCTNGSIFPYPQGPIGDQLLSWLEGGICCLDYETYKNVPICSDIISPTPFGTPYSTPTRMPTITTTPTPTLTPTPTTGCPINTYCGTKAISGQSETKCDQFGTVEIQPTIICYYKDSVTDIFTKKGSCCGSPALITPSPTLIPTITPTPLANCPDPDINCLTFCSWRTGENLVKVGTLDCDWGKSCCLTPTPTLAPLQVTSCPQPDANCIDTLWLDGVRGCPHDRIKLTSAKDCGFGKTCCLLLGTIDDTKTCEKNGGRCIKNKYSCSAGIGNGNDIEVGKCDTKLFTGYKCCR